MTPNYITASQLSSQTPGSPLPSGISAEWTTGPTTQHVQRECSFFLNPLTFFVFASASPPNLITQSRKLASL